MIDFKTISPNKQRLYENERPLVLVEMDSYARDSGIIGWNRFMCIIKDYNIWARAFSRKRLIVLPAAVGDMLGTRHDVYDIEVIGVEVVINQTGEVRRISLKEFKKLAAMCVRKI